MAVRSRGVANERVHVDEHLEVAEAYLSRALELLGKGDPHDAAEKLWASVRRVTLALTELALGRAAPERGETWRAFVARALRVAGLEGSRAEELASVFVEVRDRLHGAVFYGAVYEEQEHRPVFEKGFEYVRAVAGPVSRLAGATT